jgi:hypothetical protein
MKYACPKYLATDWHQMYSLRRSIKLMKINTGYRPLYSLRLNIKLNVNKYRMYINRRPGDQHEICMSKISNDRLAPDVQPNA